MVVCDFQRFQTLAGELQIYVKVLVSCQDNSLFWNLTTRVRNSDMVCCWVALPPTLPRSWTNLRNYLKIVMTTNQNPFRNLGIGIFTIMCKKLISISTQLQPSLIYDNLVFRFTESKYIRFYQVFRLTISTSVNSHFHFPHETLFMIWIEDKKMNNYHEPFQWPRKFVPNGRQFHLLPHTSLSFWEL